MRLPWPEYKSFIGSHGRTTIEEVHEAALRLEREASNSRRYSDYKTGMLMTVPGRDNGTSSLQSALHHCSLHSQS